MLGLAWWSEGQVPGAANRCVLRAGARFWCKKRSNHCAVRRSFGSPSSSEYALENSWMLGDSMLFQNLLDSSMGRFEDRL